VAVWIQFPTCLAGQTLCLCAWLVVVSIENVGDDGVAHNVLFLELNNTDFSQIGEAMDGINKSVFPAKNLHVRLLGVSNQADL
jgi:hypothetical protein